MYTNSYFLTCYAESMQSMTLTGSTPKGRSYAFSAVTLAATSDNLVGGPTTSSREEVNTLKGTINTMSQNTTPNTTPTNPFDSEEVSAKRQAAMAANAPILVAAWNGHKQATADLAAAAERAVNEVRCTFGVLIAGAYYPDVFATQQATKQGVSEWLKANGLPTGSEEGASTLRYHFTNAAKRVHAANPATYGPEGYTLQGQKWAPVVTLSESEAKQAQEDAAVKALQKRDTKVLTSALGRQAQESPTMVLTAMAATIDSIDLATLTLGDRAAMRQALGILAAAVDAKLEYLGSALEVAA